MRTYFLVILFFISIGNAGAQYFRTGEDPAAIKWRQLNAENFQIIYPDYYESQAQNLANVLEEVYKFGGYSLNFKPDKISVILHTQTVQSNGLVGWAPKRAELYTTPHQEIYPQDWLEQLAIHEFRHVVQIDKINENLPGLIKAILGEQGTALIFGAHLPWWFIEGDAVVTETALSNYGRGRLPSFLMEHRAQVVEKGVFSYDKAYFGSYRDYVPNHYKLGYYLVGGSRVQFGSNLWESVLDQTGHQPFTLRPLNRVLTEKTGLSKTDLYYFVFDSLQRVWQKDDEVYTSSPINLLSPPAETFTSYRCNHWLNDSEVVSYKTSFKEIPAFVKIDKNGNEEKLFRPGTVFDKSVGFRENLIVWSEQIADPRWNHSGKSLIRILNTDTKDVTDITTEFKSFSPAIAPDQTKFAVVETDFSNNYYISIYSSPDGELIDRFQTPENNYFFSPKWLNSEELAAIVLTQNGKRLARINPGGGDFEFLNEEDLGELTDLRIEGNNIYFIAGYTGKNSLYRLNLLENEIVQIYEPRFGVESPALSKDGGHIVLSDYTADGFRLIEIPVAETNPVSIENLEEASYEMAEILSEQEAGIPDFTSMDTTIYPSEKYNKTTHLFNFHSWAPVFIDVDAYEFYPGVSLMSQNKLGTAETILGYKYYLSEETGQFYAGYKFRGWYPVFDFEISSGNRASDYTFITQYLNQQGEIVRRDTTLERAEWGETTGSLDILLPLYFNKGQFNRQLQTQVGYEFNSYKHGESTPDDFFEGTFHAARYRLYYHQLLRKSYQDIFPDFGFVLDFALRNSPFGKQRLGSLTTAQTILYLPGILKNHGLKMYGGFQYKVLNGNKGFVDALRYPRGWGKINTTRMYSSAFDYALPLFYPDWNIERFLYIRRASLSLFADYAWLKGNVREENQVVGTFTKKISSVGAELTFDINALRFYAPMKVGVRASYLPEIGNAYFDFLFSIDFVSL